jgi:hypothetical protein
MTPKVVPAYRRPKYKKRKDAVPRVQTASEYERARTREKIAEAEQAELRLALAKGNALRSEDVEQVLSETCAGIRTRLATFSHHAATLIEPNASHTRHREIVAALDALMEDTLVDLLHLAAGGFRADVQSRNRKLKAFHALQKKILEEEKGK